MSSIGDRGLIYRLGTAERKLDSLEAVVTDMPVIRRDIAELVKEVAEVREEIKLNRRATWAVFLAIFTVGLSLVANVLSGSF